MPPRENFSRGGILYYVISASAMSYNFITILLDFKNCTQTAIVLYSNCAINHKKDKGNEYEKDIARNFNNDNCSGRGDSMGLYVVTRT